MTDSREQQISVTAFAAVTLFVFGLFLRSGFLLIAALSSAVMCWALSARKPRRRRRTKRYGVIYHLIDPRTGAVRYVGQTVRDPSVRLREHREEPQISVRAWVDELASHGYRPEMEVVFQKIQAGAKLDAAERGEIIRQYNRGADLLNREHNPAWNGPGYRNGVYQGRRS